MSTQAEARAEEAITLIIREFASATAANGAFHSAHEGYAVILEELDELKIEVWKKARDRNPDALIKEAKQVGAMAMRFLVDVALPLKEKAGNGTVWDQMPGEGR